MMARKGCWTCKDRKVSCDRTVPRCLRCTKAKRECGGYGVRFTWLRDHHNRAAIENSSPKNRPFVVSNGPLQWVNVVPTDICLHIIPNKINGHVSGRIVREQLTLPNIPEFISSKPSVEAPSDLELLHYFEAVVANMLPMLCMDRSRICQLLVQRAQSNDSQSSRAVYYAILALAAYLRGDDSLYVDRMKRSALRELYTDLNPSMCEGIAHIGANLVLCILEMQQTNGKDSCWVGYVVGVKHVIDAVKQGDPKSGDDASVILGWVYYFDVMSRFSFRHWRTEHIRAVAEELGYDSNASISCQLQYIMARTSFARGVPNISNHAHQVIRLLAEVSEIAIYSSEPRYLSNDYQQSLNDLRLRLENVSTCDNTPKIRGASDACQVFGSLDGDKVQEDLPVSAAQATLNHTEQLLEITRLAGLIYLERVSRNFSGNSAKIESWTQSALAILGQLESCFCPFALLIIGCETDRDEDRVIILDLYTRMEKQPHFQSSMEVKALIQTAWNQQDLAEDGELEYIHKLNVVLSSRDIIPSLI